MLGYLKLLSHLPVLHCTDVLSLPLSQALLLSLSVSTLPASPFFSAGPAHCTPPPFNSPLQLRPFPSLLRRSLVTEWSSALVKRVNTSCLSVI